MEIKKLSVGNLIWDFDQNTFYPVEEIKENSQGNLSVIYRNGSIMSIDPEPIPLSQEWLLKFGYAIQPWGYVKEERPLIRFSLTPNEKYWIELGNGFRIDLPYVHTLQNFIQLIEKELNY
jgi:hypothetical protein